MAFSLWSMRNTSAVEFVSYILNVRTKYFSTTSLSSYESYLRGILPYLYINVDISYSVEED